MEHDELMQKVIRLSAEQVAVDPRTISCATQFAVDLNFDSLDTVNLGMTLEDEFDIKIPDTAIDQMKTVGDAIDFVLAEAKAKH